MKLKSIKRKPRTLKEHNERVLMACDILTGKEFRNLRRKNIKN